MTWPRWLRRAVRNRHRHAIEQVPRRWRGGRTDDSARTRRKILITQVSKKYSGEAWATHGKRPYTPARYEAVPSQPDAAELGRLEGAFHRSLRPGAQLTTSLLGTSGLPTPVGACVEINQ